MPSYYYITGGISLKIEFYINIAAIFFTAAFFSFILTPLAKKLAIKIGAVDIPCDSRRMHSKPIPRLGGIAIYGGFLISVFIFGDFILSLEMNRQIIGMLLGSGVIVITGIVDDRIALKAYIKFAAQTFAAAITVLSGVRIDLLSAWGMPDIVTIIVTVIWIVGVTNAINLIDGLDGLAVGISFIASMTMLAILSLTKDFDLALICAALAGTCMGFIPFNFNPATIFMGDTGAMFLGFMLASLSVQGIYKSYRIVSFTIPFLILAIPIFDTVVSMARRLKDGRSPMSADRGHLHHRLIDLGLSQRQAVVILYIGSLIFAVAAIALTGLGPANALYIIVMVFVSAIIIMRSFLDVFSIKRTQDDEDTEPKSEQLSNGANDEISTNQDENSSSEG